ncbi:hypothetical protein ACIPVK_00100 [Paeniglutamicibacter sp. MACA_103]|uniref:hypothetical protein n=1 Tax=Paeniglutamicibacter sp. MACA_103 TaxID=3377337 RepID=UPI003893980D
MSGSNHAGVRKKNLRFRRTKILWLLIAAALFLVSCLLQLVAALQRWVVLAGAGGTSGLSVENHRYDYYFPAPTWEPLGTTAVLLEEALLVQALGILAMAAGVLFLPDPTVDHIRSVGIAIAAFEALLAAILAASFAVIGSHTFPSGLSGNASGYQDAAVLLWALLLTGLVKPLALAGLWRVRLPAASAACVFLTGTSFVGYLAATYVISPIMAGSYYDARWTETVMAVSTGAAAAAMPFGAGDVVRRTVAAA